MTRPKLPPITDTCAALAGHVEAHRAARAITDKHPPRGVGILLEVSGDRVVGALQIESSPVLRPEAEILIEVGNTSRPAMTLVEAYGSGPAPSGNLRRGADIFVADPEVARFVVAAIREKIARS